MFNKSDMMIPVTVAEQKVKDVESELKDVIDEISDEYTSIINTMKSASLNRGWATQYVGNDRCSSGYEIGCPTPYFSNGIRIFTGDEVEFKSGKKGIIVKYGDGRFMIQTNKETAELVTNVRIDEMRLAFSSFEGVVNSSSIKITRHFNTYTDGEEVAKGRKGNRGFVVELD